jgi:peptide/nickel transport system permease protein
MIPTLLLISIFSFVMIQLPPGDYLTSYISNLQQAGQPISVEQIEGLKRQFDLDKPMHIRYFKWIVGGVFRGDFGYSFGWQRPVSEVIGKKLFLTLIISLLSLLFCWIIAFPIGIYSAVKQFSLGDYFFTFIGFLGLSIPAFLLALILMFLGYKYFGISIGGLFSPGYLQAAWSWGKLVDLAKHIWLPVIVIGAPGTAGLIRIMRNNLLDELSKPYVTTARAKGLKESKILFKYSVRLALIPFISTAGWQLPQIISNSAIVSVVISLPTVGPTLLRALKTQDMYLSGTLVMFLAFLTVFGTLVSDILLVMIDPRIKYT